MQSVIRGRAWKFGDNIDTDQIALTAYSRLPMEEMKFHVLERIRPEFARGARAGDIIVAGRNFGCGSSRETAPVAIKALGIAAVAAESFARIFYRNAVAIGLAPVTCEGIAGKVTEGDELEINLTTAEVLNLTRGTRCRGEVLPREMLEVLAKGGIQQLLKEMNSEG
jgi:3-isopropylmalate/(R)-2-methylmalate dehydratase small subunit